MSIPRLVERTGGIGALPDCAGVVARDLFVGGDEPGEAVGFGICDDEAVEGIAGPLFVEGGSGLTS